MNRNFALALFVACAASGPVFADDITIDPHPFVSTASRAQVMDDLRQYRQSGVNPWADDYNPIAHAKSTMSREQVTAEYIASRGMVAAFSGEDSGSSYLASSAARARPAKTDLARAE
jgi:hypothetical protein